MREGKKEEGRNGGTERGKGGKGSKWRVYIQSIIIFANLSMTQIMMRAVI